MLTRYRYYHISIYIGFYFTIKEYFARLKTSPLMVTDCKDLASVWQLKLMRNSGSLSLFILIPSERPPQFISSIDKKSVLWTDFNPDTNEISLTLLYVHVKRNGIHTFAI